MQITVEQLIRDGQDEIILKISPRFSWENDEKENLELRKKDRLKDTKNHRSESPVLWKIERNFCYE